MISSITPDSFYEPLAAVQRLLNRFAEQGIVIGGIAASLLGEPRATADIDAIIVLSVDDLPLLITAAEEEGLLPRIPDAETFARRNRVLLLKQFAELLEMPEVWQDIARMRPKGKRRK